MNVRSTRLKERVMTIRMAIHVVADLVIGLITIVILKPYSLPVAILDDRREVQRQLQEQGATAPFVRALVASFLAKVAQRI